MDASRISMGRLLSYLFEVTERFGMETRTELILLQRTMVVVEGVARSLNPQINIWQVARPVVEDYILCRAGGRSACACAGAEPALGHRFRPGAGAQVCGGRLRPSTSSAGTRVPPASVRKVVPSCICASSIVARIVAGRVSSSSSPDQLSTKNS
jgi:ubiquinone biosynthesis protein